jgi:DNA-cytosine methyltransferase
LQFNLSDLRLTLSLSGPPCQPYSTEGLGLGDADVRCCLDDVVQTIDQIRPKLFIVENVASLLNAPHKSTYLRIKSALLRMKDDKGQPAYHVRCKLLNSYDFGVPQCRSRVYIVGVRADTATRLFKFPSPVAKPRLGEFLLQCSGKNPSPTALTPTNFKNITYSENAMRAGKVDPRSTWAIIDAGTGRPGKLRPFHLHHCPCITKTRARAGDFYCTRLQRKLDNREMAALQGFRPGEVDFGKLSRNQAGALIGNAMTVPVLESLLREGLAVIGAL